MIDYTLGTASVVVAGLLASERLTGKKLKEGSYLFFGAGEVCMYVIMYVCILTVLKAAIGIANLIVDALVEEGISEDEARAKCWLFDSKGLIVKVGLVWIY